MISRGALRGLRSAGSLVDQMCSQVAAKRARIVGISARCWLSSSRRLLLWVASRSGRARPNRLATHERRLCALLPLALAAAPGWLIPDRTQVRTRSHWRELLRAISNLGSGSCSREGGPWPEWTLRGA